MAMSQRRTAVRMLQGPCPEIDTSAAGSTPSCTTGPPPARQPPTPGPQSFRRRSLCFPEEACCSDGNRGGSITVPGSPGPSWKSASIPVCSSPASFGAGDASVRPSATSPAGHPPDQDSPHHLSVPLTLLSLHNGGARHSPRNLSRDVSPLAPLITREGSISSGLGDTDSATDGGKSAAREHGRAQISPPKLPSVASMSNGLPSSGCASISLAPVIGVRAATPAGGRVATPALKSPSARAAVSGVATSVTSATSTSGGAASRGGSGTLSLATAPVGSFGGGGDAPHAPAATTCAFLPSNSGISTTGGGAIVSALAETATGVGGGGGITLPSHLGSHRPPTPVCKEDDLLSSLRHMSSPSRRRSRFASVAESSLLIAAAAAIAAEDAGLLDSPPGSFSTPAGGGGLVGDPRVRRSVIPGLTEGGSLASGLAGEAPASPSLLLRSLGPAVGVGVGTGPGLEAVLSRLPSVSMSLSMTWRSASQLMPVPEEPPQSRGDPVASSSSALSDGTGSSPGAAPCAPGRLALGGPPAAVGCGGTSSRRLRAGSGAPGAAEAGAMAADSSSAAQLMGARRAVRSGTRSNSEPLDDSLSSFMHSFGPGTQGSERRSPTAATDRGQSASAAGSGRIAAR